MTAHASMQALCREARCVPTGGRALPDTPQQHDWACAPPNSSTASSVSLPAQSNVCSLSGPLSTLSVIGGTQFSPAYSCHAHHTAAGGPVPPDLAAPPSCIPKCSHPSPRPLTSYPKYVPQESGASPWPRPVMPMSVSHSVLNLPTCVPNSGSCIVPVSRNALKAPVSTNLQPEVATCQGVKHRVLSLQALPTACLKCSCLYKAACSCAEHSTSTASP